MILRRCCSVCLRTCHLSQNVGKRRWSSTSSDSEAGEKSSRDESTTDSRLLGYSPAERPKFVVAERNLKWQKYREEMATIRSEMYDPKEMDRAWRYPQFEDPHIDYVLRSGTQVSPTNRFKHVLSPMESHQKALRVVSERGYYANIMEQTVDFLILGAGMMGTYMAYALKRLCGESLTVLVVDRDLEYSYASSMLSLGCIRQQFSHPINLHLARKSAEFFRKAKKSLAMAEIEPPDLEFHPMGHLILVEDERAEKFFEYHKVQTEAGAYVELLSPSMLQQRFPWLNTDGIVLGSHGLKDEGWVNPYPLLKALKGKAEFLGVQFMQGEVFDFNPRLFQDSISNRDDAGNPIETCNHCLVRLPTDVTYQLDFTNLFMASGSETAALTSRLGIGMGEGLRRIPYPMVPRKRHIYLIEAQNGPVLDFPVLVDTSGVICRRDGLGGYYLVTKVPTPEEEPDPGNNVPDDSYFHEVIHPLLAERVKGFADAKLIKSWAANIEENVWDGSPIIGNHPHFQRIWWAGGLGSHAMQMSPAICDGLAESIIRGRYEEHNDMSVFHWIRMMAGEKTVEDLTF